MRNLREILFCSAFLICTPAFAGESFNCTFAVLNDEPHQTGKSVVEITGDDLTWKVEQPLVFPQQAARSTTFHYRIIKNNDVGVVAVSPSSEIDKGIGTMVGAIVITLVRSGMTVQMGSAGSSGTHDLLSGSCQPK